MGQHIDEGRRGPFENWDSKSDTKCAIRRMRKAPDWEPEHDPEKSAAVFRKDHAQTISLDAVPPVGVSPSGIGLSASLKPRLGLVFTLTGFHP
jgi:hypothetical protein